MAGQEASPGEDEQAGGTTRRMVRATLLGSHSHATLCGVQVHVWLRREAYLARGSYQGRRFGKTLGKTILEAQASLVKLLSEIDDGRFLRPSDAGSRPLADGRTPQLTFRDLCNEFLVAKRKLRGFVTADNYRSRLAPALDFAEAPDARSKWRLASDINHEFAVDLRCFLNARFTTPNGRVGGRAKTMSQRQIYNVLETVRNLLAWAHRAEIRKLPLTWANPFTKEILGDRPRKSPLRSNPLPFDVRLQMIQHMDHWQFLHLGLLLVLPIRRSEGSGLLVSDFDVTKRLLRFGTRLGGGDFTKGHQDFELPVPAELFPILQACVAGRTEGPLLRARCGFGDERTNLRPEDIQEQLNAALASSKTSVLSANDRKSVFRDLLVRLGGVHPDHLTREFADVAHKAGVPKAITLHSARAAITQEMKQADIHHLDLRYLTGHTTRDILNDYTPVDPLGAMERYFATIRPLLDGIASRAKRLEIREVQ